MGIVHGRTTCTSRPLWGEVGLAGGGVEEGFVVVITLIRNRCSAYPWGRQRGWCTGSSV